MKFDWINVFLVGLVLTMLAGAILLCVLIILALPWIFMNWMLVFGGALLIGLTLMAIAYYMEFIHKIHRKGGT